MSRGCPIGWTCSFASWANKSTSLLMTPIANIADSRYLDTAFAYNSDLRGRHVLCVHRGV